MGLCSGEKKKKQKSDEYAFYYCCNVMTSLMRSVEIWGSHFVVSPIHFPAQENPLWNCPQTHPLRWMHSLMLQTTEHHSVPFYGLHPSILESCDNRFFLCSQMLHRKRNACFHKSVFTDLQEYKWFCFPLFV